ncbi:hypothetical protein FOZ63_007614 [Perkinsus olseni]|uniref:Uncharacterized protein n=1 Tax=Perkinsus olseni TaxID=32597 RepID=A0A7J6RNW6_PEROL|nr:hypothetical protein FOZ62_006908 [Perkinsus olseni]KAF4722145.1 hypothetical protein FOZ63_007614 [Perkinsus olseni]
MRGYKYIVLLSLLAGLVRSERPENGHNVVFNEQSDEVSPDDASGFDGAPFNVDFEQGQGSGILIPMGGFSFVPMEEFYDSIDDVHELAGGDKAVVAQPQQPKRLRRGVVPVVNVLNGLIGQMLNQMMAGSLGGIEGESTFSMNTTASEVVISGQLPKQTLRTELGQEDNGITVKQILPDDGGLHA